MDCIISAISDILDEFAHICKIYVSKLVMFLIDLSFHSQHYYLEIFLPGLMAVVSGIFLLNLLLPSVCSIFMSGNKVI